MCKCKPSQHGGALGCQNKIASLEFKQNKMKLITQYKKMRTWSLPVVNAICLFRTVKQQETQKRKLNTLSNSHNESKNLYNKESICMKNCIVLIPIQREMPCWNKVSISLIYENNTKRCYMKETRFSKE